MTNWVMSWIGGLSRHCLTRWMRALLEKRILMMLQMRRMMMVVVDECEDDAKKKMMLKMVLIKATMIMDERSRGWTEAR